MEYTYLLCWHSWKPARGLVAIIPEEAAFGLTLGLAQGCCILSSEYKPLSERASWMYSHIGCCLRLGAFHPLVTEGAS